MEQNLIAIESNNHASPAENSVVDQTLQARRQEQRLQEMANISQDIDQSGLILANQTHQDLNVSTNIKEINN